MIFMEDPSEKKNKSVKYYPLINKTVEEPWVHHHTSETMQQSKQWLFPDDLATKKNQCVYLQTNLGRQFFERHTVKSTSRTFTREKQGVANEMTTYWTSSTKICKKK